MSTDTDPNHAIDPDGYALIGACFDVYNEMGNGYLEDVYQESLEIELTDRGIPFVAQPKLPIFYKGRLLRKHYEADLLVLDKIIVELKAVKNPPARARSPVVALLEINWSPSRLPREFWRVPATGLASSYSLTWALHKCS